MKRDKWSLHLPASSVLVELNLCASGFVGAGPAIVDLADLIVSLPVTLAPTFRRTKAANSAVRAFTCC